jgi:hypothetical protein
MFLPAGLKFNSRKFTLDVNSFQKSIVGSVEWKKEINLQIMGVHDPRSKNCIATNLLQMDVILLQFVGFVLDCNFVLFLILILI